MTDFFAVNTQKKKKKVVRNFDMFKFYTFCEKWKCLQTGSDLYFDSQSHFSEDKWNIIAISLGFSFNWFSITSKFEYLKYWYIGSVYILLDSDNVLVVFMCC